MPECRTKKEAVRVASASRRWLAAVAAGFPSASVRCYPAFPQSRRHRHPAACQYRAHRRTSRPGLGARVVPKRRKPNDRPRRQRAGERHINRRQRCVPLEGPPRHLNRRRGSHIAKHARALHTRRLAASGSCTIMHLNRHRCPAPAHDINVRRIARRRNRRRLAENSNTAARKGRKIESSARFDLGGIKDSRPL